MVMIFMGGRLSSFSLPVSLSISISIVVLLLFASSFDVFHVYVCVCLLCVQVTYPAATTTPQCRSVFISAAKSPDAVHTFVLLICIIICSLFVHVFVCVQRCCSTGCRKGWAGSSVRLWPTRSATTTSRPRPDQVCVLSSLLCPCVFCLCFVVFVVFLLCCVVLIVHSRVACCVCSLCVLFIR